MQGQSGDGIILADSGVIGTSQVGANISNTMLTLSNYDKLSPNILLNPSFNSGDLTSWNSTGSCVVQTTDYPGYSFEVSINNLSNINQQVSEFSGKHPVFEFWHKGEQIICSLEMRDGSDVYIDGVNRIIPNNDNWTKYSIGMYNYSSTAVSAKVTLASVWDGSIVTNCSLIASDYYTALNIGDEFDANSTDINRFYGKKLMLGSGLPGINNSLLDVRGNSNILGDLTVTGTITSGPIYGSIGTQKWVTSIVFSSGSQTQINFSSGSIQLVSGQIFGISSGNTGTMTLITYLYLDSDVSTSVLQTTNTYSNVIGANKIFVGTCYPGTTGYASFVSQSNSLPLINAGDLITPFSIVNGNLSINSVQAQNISVSSLSAIIADMGILTAGIIRLASAGSYLTFGSTPPPSSTGAPFTAGVFQDYTGLYALNGTTLNASISQNGVSAGNGTVILDASGESILIPAVYDAKNSIKFVDGSGNKEMEIYVTDAGTSSIGRINLNNSATGTNLGRLSILSLASFSKTGNNAYVSLSAASDSGTSVGMTLYSISGGQSYFLFGGSGSDVDFNISGNSNTNLFYLDAGNDSIGMGTATPNANAILDLTSTTKTFMPPRMTTTQRNAVSSPTAGMVIYNSTTNKLNVYTTAWEAVTSV